MKLLTVVILVLAAVAAVAATVRAATAKAAKPFLHPLFCDHAVLQRDARVPIWGWAPKGTKVTVKFQSLETSTKADAKGRWQAVIGPFPAGGPYELEVASATKTVKLSDLMLGDVWICSGQSNMEQGIGAAGNPEREIAAANYPGIRLFTVPKRIEFEPQETVDGSWAVCTPETIAKDGWGGFSAAAYYFGRRLHQDLKVPVGLIHTSWGGTIAEAWVSAGGLKPVGDFDKAVAGLGAEAKERRKGLGGYWPRMQKWYAESDPGSKGKLGWAAAALDLAEWKTMALPTKWEDAGLPDFDGVVWFRLEVDLPAGWAGRAAILHLGPIDDRDTTWVNGKLVGHLDMYNAPRDYEVPQGVLKAGKNEIAVRVLDTGGAGGLWGKPEDMTLEATGESAPGAVSLAGAWRYRVGVALGDVAPPPAADANNPHVVTVLYNGMVAPLIPFAIKGAIWYQGESNVGRAPQYRRLLAALIRDWRARFGVGDFGFYIVQLAGFGDPRPEAGDDSWAELREAQWLVSREVPATGLATAIDIGESKDIHPKNKQDVGARLALAAEALTYGMKVEASGPSFRGMKKEGAAIRIEFDHVGGGLIAMDGKPLAGFSIAGADGKWAWGDARIDGETLVVSSPKVPDPVAVRYAWTAFMECNFYSKEGLPALPFRTDAPAR
ncbi:MAG: sialate O-acetylesterase [Candidatus Coatesbacteria bacterium]